MLKLAPDIVNLSDGLLELVLIRQPRNMFELNQLVLSLNGEIYDCEMINLISTRNIKIHCPSKPDWTLDGEFEPGKDYVEITNIPKVFKIILKK
jgi:diacylglycerol kinase family enzyme